MFHGNLWPSSFDQPSTCIHTYISSIRQSWQPGDLRCPGVEDVKGNNRFLKSGVTSSSSSTERAWAEIAFKWWFEVIKSSLERLLHLLSVMMTLSLTMSLHDCWCFFIVPSERATVSEYEVLKQPSQLQSCWLVKNTCYHINIKVIIYVDLVYQKTRRRISHCL